MGIDPAQHKCPCHDKELLLGTLAKSSHRFPHCNRSRQPGTNSIMALSFLARAGAGLGQDREEPQHS